MHVPLTMPSGPLAAGDVVLRGYADTDTAMLTDLATDLYVALIGTLPSRADEVAALAYVERQRGRAAEGVGWSFCIADRTTDEALGGAGLWLVRDDPTRLTAGYLVAPRSRGRGVARDALRALTSFAWTVPTAARVELFVEPWNVASLRTAEGAGYVREALLHQQPLGDRRVDLVRFATGRPAPR